MNEALITRWNSVVSPEDQVYVIGDFVMGKRAETMPLLELLNGTIGLVPGNHDACHPMLRKWEKGKEAFENVGIRVLPTQFEHTIGNQKFLVCHFPYTGDSEPEDRYQDQRPINRGLPLLHGHIHDMWKVKDNMINIGSDVWDFTPVEESTLLELTKTSGII